MSKEVILHQIQDWSKIDERTGFWGRIDLSRPDQNFGIHRYGNGLWTSGQVGIGRVFNRDNMPIQENGKDHVLVISSSFGLDPWKMLESVMQDPEYDSYLNELEKDGRFLFKIHYDQQLIKIPQGEDYGAEILFALSFLNSCYSLCKKGLKKTLLTHEENYAGKIRGKISVSKNVKYNVSKGRCDKFYCKYIDFTEDNIENRIIKAALLKCRDCLKEKFGEHSNIWSKVSYCKNRLRHISTVGIKTSDFNSVSISGLYSYYKPVIQQARAILGLRFNNHETDNFTATRRNIYVIPYAINMETLFEYYARTELKKILHEQYSVERYSKHYYLQANVHAIEETEKNIHLMPFCIPDIVVLNNGLPVFVIDAKYKPHNRPDRSDSHQLLAYALLTGVKKCGFILPGEHTTIKEMTSSGTNFLPLVPEELKYYELLLGNDDSCQEFERILM